MQTFDIIIIGGGPAGYTAAIRASQLGMQVACIEKRSTLGGTCLNVGCIPSKALLNFSHEYENAKKHFPEIGIKGEISLELSTLLGKKDQIVSDLCKGIEGLFAKNKVKRFTGHGTIKSSTVIEVNGEQITGRNILIATGSDIFNIPGIAIDEERIVSSTGALTLKTVPEHMVVIGGGYIGLELGSVWRRLGSKVTVLDNAASILPMMDLEVGNVYGKILQKQGMQFTLNTNVLSVVKNDKNLAITIEDKNNKTQSQIICDVALVAVGRKPHTDKLGLENVGIKLDDRGRISVNHKLQTSVPNIYAVGDVIIGPMLAHKAEEEAVAAVETMAGQAGHVNYDIIPSVVYTDPEVATVGKTEEQLKQEAIEYKIGKFPFLANSRARTMCSTEGFVKILADKHSDRVLGAHIIGPNAGTLIAEIAAYMEFGAAAEDIARTCHAHPTLSEAVKEAALAVDKRCINF